MKKKYCTFSFTLVNKKIRSFVRSLSSHKAVICFLAIFPSGMSACVTVIGSFTPRA